MDSSALESLHNEEEEHIIKSIPDDIIADILSRLPVKSLLRFKSVCKSWYNLLTHDPSFVRMHINQSIKIRRYTLMARAMARMYTIPVQALRKYNMRPYFAQVDCPLKSQKFCFRSISESCDGLFLIFGDIMRQPNALGFMQYTHILYLWNPSTKEHKVLPPDISQLPQYPEKPHWAFGLGYDSIKNDYKVIRIMRHCLTSNYHNCTPECNFETLVHLYSLRGNSCRRIQGIPGFCTDHLHYDLSDTGVFVKGAIHWWLQARDFYRMLAFDVSSEEYKEVPMPENVKIDGSTNLIVGALENNLCFYQYLLTDCRLDLFMMKLYGVKESWTKFYSVHLYSVHSFARVRHSDFRPIWVSNTETLILVRMDFGDGEQLYLHVKTKRIPEHICVNLNDVVNIEPWCESLVSLNQYANVRKE